MTANNPVREHRSSYPIGNASHGTDERPDWGPFCVKCKQSWPCEASVAIDQTAKVRDGFKRLFAGESSDLIGLSPAEALSRWSIKDLDLLHSASGMGPEWLLSHRRRVLVDYADGHRDE